MWYVMQVMSGREVQTIFMMEKNLSNGIVERCFIPMRRLKKKYFGKWQEVTEKLFPGYVFLFTNQPQLLYQELKEIPALTKILGSCGDYFTALSEEDIQFMKRLEWMAGEIGRNVCVKRERIEWKGNGKQEKSRNDRKYHEQQVSKTSEIGLSKVVVCRDRQIRVVSGPLKNLEGQIKKINLHKRIAVVEAEFMGNRSVIHLGIDILNNMKEM